MEILNIPDVTNNSLLKEMVFGFAAGDYGYMLSFEMVMVSGDSLFMNHVVRFDFDTFSNVTVLNLNLNMWIGSGFAHEGAGYLIGAVNGQTVNVIRFDLAFDDTSAVSLLDLSNVINIGETFDGGFAAGGYGYLFPSYDYSTYYGYHGKLVRFDIATFGQQDLSILDLTNTNAELNGFCAGFSKGDYGYLLPIDSGKVVRFDLDTFDNVTLLDLARYDDTYPSGYRRSPTSYNSGNTGFAVGDYGYFTQYYGNVFRFDLVAFNNNNVVLREGLNISSTSSNNPPFEDCFANDAYGFFVPSFDNGGSAVVRFPLTIFDSPADFSSRLQQLDLSGVFGGNLGFRSGFAADGHGYLMPSNMGSSFNYAPHGNVVRFDLEPKPLIPPIGRAAMDAWITAFKTGTDSNAGLLAAATATIDGESGFIEDNYGSIEDWDTSNVVNMSSLFSLATHFNEDIRNWDTSNVETMDYMFRSASSFNWNIRSWNISSVTTIRYMFRFASDFNHNLSYSPPSPLALESGWQVRSATYVLDPYSPNVGYEITQAMNTSGVGDNANFYPSLL